MPKKASFAIPLSLVLSLAPILLKTPDLAQAVPLPVAAAAPAKALSLAAGATLTGSPVANIVADFAATEAASGRTVELQALQNGAWVKVASATMAADGTAGFGTVAASGTSYRAVAGQYTYTQKVKVKTVKKVKVKVKKSKHSKKTKYVYKKKTVTKTVKQTVAVEPSVTPELLVNWNLVRDYQFDGSAVDAEWTQRNTGSYAAKGRLCSAPQATNTTTGNGFATLWMSQETDSATIAAARAAGCPGSQGTVYRNAMIGTQGTFSIGSGVMATRVKFPKAQGVHGGVWIRTENGIEIDTVESYGLGKGFTNVYHLNGVEHKLYKGNIKDPAWWDQYHVFSLEWSRSTIVFRLDGEITSRANVDTWPGDYFLVISQLSSDWELDRVNPATLPAAMSVDWVKVWS